MRGFRSQNIQLSPCPSSCCLRIFQYTTLLLILGASACRHRNTKIQRFLCHVDDQDNLSHTQIPSSISLKPHSLDRSRSSIFCLSLQHTIVILPATLNHTTFARPCFNMNTTTTSKASSKTASPTISSINSTERVLSAPRIKTQSLFKQMGVLPETGYSDFEAQVAAAMAAEAKTMKRMPSSNKMDKIHQGRMQKSAG